MRTIFIAAGFLALAGSATSLMAQEAPTLLTQVQATLDDYLERYAFPGATAAIVLPDGSVVTAATGLADVENARAMTPETPMLAASIGKTFVAATVLALESEGALSRADLLSTHLGDRPWFAALPNADSITIGQLLHHTSGLPDHVHLPAFQQAWAGRRPRFEMQYGLPDRDSISRLRSNLTKTVRSKSERTIKDARRSYEDWWQALDWVRDGLMGCRMLREVEVTGIMPRDRPWEPR